jgi:hypothetical protein
LTATNLPARSKPLSNSNSDSDSSNVAVVGDAVNDAVMALGSAAAALADIVRAYADLHLDTSLFVNQSRS